MTDERTYKLPPFALRKFALCLLAVRVDLFRDRDAVMVMWWQASIAPGGVNEALTKTHWAAQT